MNGIIRYLDPKTGEIRFTRGRVVDVLGQGGPVKHRVAVIDRGKSELRIPERRLVDKGILDEALTVL
ncbi:MAG: hypothetical protein WCP22_03215 [Chlamydiota bacterium]